MNVHYWNAQSIGNKTTTICEYLLDKDVDILVITETWLAEDDPVTIGECTPTGYSFFSFPRPGDEHGGIAFISKSCLKLSISPTGVDTVTFEHASMTDNSKSFHLTAIYRPPPSSVNGFTYTQFMDEFEDFLGVLTTLHGKPLLMGDINIHVNKPSKPDVARYLSLLAEHDFKQYANKPTHKKGNILDHIICRPEDHLLLSQASCVVTPFRYGSDHHMIQCNINRSKPKPERRVFTSRSYKDLDMETFTSDLDKATRCVLSVNDPNSQVELYNSSIREVLNKHCPEKTRSQKLMTNPKWYNDDVRDARCERRRLERRWKKTHLDEDRHKYIAQNVKVTELIKDAKICYFKETLDKADAKTMYSTLKMLLNSSGKKLPACSSNSDLSNQFARYFTDKVENIRTELDEMCVSAVHSTTNELDKHVCDDVMHNYDNDKINVSDEQGETSMSRFTKVLDCFTAVDEEEVRNIMAKLPNKTSPLDPFPTWLLKRCIDTILPVIMSIVNNSLRSGAFPLILRQAVITPLIKKPTLNPDLLKNYRPVSNLPTLGKIIEYPAVSRFKHHLNVNNLTETYQSAYKSSHSTETALLKVKNDMLNELDKGKALILVLLDLSSAFDTIDHKILVERMKKEFGVTGTAKEWFVSYLSDRTNKVCVLSDYSDVQTLHYGVPQGSIAGPPIFTAYSQPVAHIIRSFNIGYHIYADDTQLYTSFDPKSDTDIAAAKLRMTNCIAEIRSWMLSNKLKLNDTKTELFLVASSRLENSVSDLDLNLRIGGSVISPSQTVKNLGIIFDSCLSMKKHVSSLCRNINFHLRNLWRIRRFMDRSTCAHAVRSLILSRLDYGNSLLGGLSVTQTQRLQRLQNRAARLIYQVGRRTSAPPLLRELHWLPVQQRIEFKILVHVFNCLYGTSPLYLQDLLTYYKPGRPGLRSSQDFTRLAIPSTKKSFGDSSFSVLGPTLWNNLPSTIRDAPNVQCFKKLLKTHLFPVQQVK
tara:strand:+ start:158 stop:3112 length:2955 start_codon:yes stop_codon:yes gene_type:complete